MSQKKRKKNTKALYLTYSGKIRDIYANSIADTYVHQNLTSFMSPLFGSDEKKHEKQNLWGPFVVIKTLGYLFNENFKFSDENLTLKKFDPSLFLNIGHKGQILNSDNYFYLKDKREEIPSCQNPNKALKTSIQSYS